jgi:hypothetical protein
LVSGTESNTDLSAGISYVYRVNSANQIKRYDFKLGAETQITGAASAIGAGQEGSAFIISSTPALFVGSKV